MKKARVAAGFSLKIEVECGSLEEGVEAVKYSVQRAASSELCVDFMIG